MAQSQQEWLSWEASDWTLPGGEVHVWRLAAELGSSPRAGYLDAAEHLRAQRFARSEDRVRFAAGRSILRLVLSRHLSCSPSDLQLGTDRFGRPLLTHPHVGTLDFNVSHSGRYVLVALASGRRVGIDVEAVRDDIEIFSIMGDLFTPGERAAVASLSGSSRMDTFFRYWTRKEALAKAIGTGLGARFETLDVRSGLLPDWEVRTLAVGSGYYAAVAAGGHDWRLVCWRA